jgi:general secretion pathway protein G
MRHSFLKRAALRGFTLLELMIVIVIIGILAAAIIPNFSDSTSKAKISKAKADIRVLKSALDMYKLDNGNYPSIDQGLQALVQKPTIGKIPNNYKAHGYLEKSEIPNDPWGNKYIFLNPGQHGAIDLLSYGNDGKPGGEGEDADVTSWQAN